MFVLNKTKQNKSIERKKRMWQTFVEDFPLEIFSFFVSISYNFDFVVDNDFFFVINL